MRIVQVQSASGERRLGVVSGSTLTLSRFPSVCDAARAAFDRSSGLATVIGAALTPDTLDYGAIYEGAASSWRLLPPVDFPGEPARCLITGTGLTHLASAANRDAMHAGAVTLTDSMRMYQWGVEGGRPAPGAIGVAPEWFYKGSGLILRAHGEPLDVPSYAGDGGEEPEICGAYIIDPAGNPCRLGLMQGNEFSDHAFEKKNYLNLAGSKLRNCSAGPELLIGASFQDVPGVVAITRAGKRLWSRDIRSGEANMCHSLANMEHHHFKFEGHRRPGDVHIHFFGASAFSFGDGLSLQDGDVMEVAFEGFGPPLRNPLRIAPGPDRLVAVRAL